MHQTSTSDLADDTLLFQPNLPINGPIGDQTLTFALDRLAAVRATQDDLIVEINTTGGDADTARRIALEIRLFRRMTGRRAWCVGKTNVYSAGVTIFAAVPRECRFLTSDAVLLVHERRLNDQLTLNGPIRSCIQIVREQLATIEAARELELEGFRELVEGSDLSEEQLYDRASENYYLHADEALELGLISRIIG